jgi:hypothetical protein
MVNNFKILLAAMLLHPLILSGGRITITRYREERPRHISSIEKVNKFQKFKNQLIDDCYYVFKIEKVMTHEKYYSIISPILEEAKMKFTSLDICLKSTNYDLRQDYYESLINLIACHFNLLLDNKNNI